METPSPKSDEHRKTMSALVSGQATKKPRKVLFVITKSNFGGAQRYVFDMATRLPREEFEPVVMLGNAQNETGPGLLAKKLEEAGIRTIVTEHLTRDIGFSDFLAFFAIFDAIRTERPDVLHLNSSKAGALGALAGRVSFVPNIIFTAHGWAFGEKRNFLSRAFIFLVSWLTVWLSHTTICVSGYDRALMAPAPFTRKKLLIIRNGIDAFEPQDREKAREELFSTDSHAHVQDAWVLSNSELTANKNLKTGMDAVAAYNAGNQKKIYWSLIGEGEERQNLVAHATRLGISDQVRFLGYVPDARKYYRAFDAFFLPSAKEGLPYVLLEAGIAALPVAGTPVGGVPEIVGEGVEGILARPSDVQGLSEALKSVLEHPEWGEKLREKVLREYSLDVMIRETVVLYSLTRAR